MAGINGLPVVWTPSTAKTSQLKRATKSNKTVKSNKTKSSKAVSTLGQPTQTAQAVSTSLHSFIEAERAQAHIHYDLPDDKTRKALDTYLAIMNQAEREKWMHLLGVDKYI